MDMFQAEGLCILPINHASSWFKMFHEQLSRISLHSKQLVSYPIISLGVYGYNIKYYGREVTTNNIHVYMYVESVLCMVKLQHNI